MPRSVRSDISLLLQEARAMELLASEAEVRPDRLQDYWNLSTDLIALVLDIEEFQVQHPNAGYDDPTMFTLKHRLREIQSRLARIADE